MKEIKLTKGYIAHVDDCDYDRVSSYKWCANVTRRNLYAQAKVAGKDVYLHRFLLQATTGMLVDHIDHNGLNNIRSNLRIVTHSQNQHNSRLSSNNTSGVKGVSWHKQRGKWRARVNLHGKEHSLGLFSTKEEAEEVVRKKRLELHGKYSCDK